MWTKELRVKSQCEMKKDRSRKQEKMDKAQDTRIKGQSKGSKTLGIQNN